MTFEGIHVAALTPHREGHEIDIAAALELIDYLSGAGVRGIAMMGSTGEFLHITPEERIRLIGFAVKRTSVPVIAGVSDSTLDGAVTQAQAAADCGAAAVLLMPPYFFRYPQADVREFFLRFADRLDGAAPILLYNIPLFTTPIEAATAADLLGTGAFAGIKDSSGDWEYFSSLLGLRQVRPFTLLVGHDAIFRRGRSAGASGGVSGVACAVPELMLGLDRAIEMGLAEKVEKLARHLDDFLGWLSRFPVPVGVKEATAARGLKVGPLAVPLAPASQQQLAEFREWFLGWLPAVQADAKEH